MTPAEILHKYGNDCAILFRDFNGGGLTIEEQTDFKKQQATLRDSALVQLRKAFAEESLKSDTKQRKGSK